MLTSDAPEAVVSDDRAAGVQPTGNPRLGVRALEVAASVPTSPILCGLGRRVTRA